MFKWLTEIEEPIIPFNEENGELLAYLEAHKEQLDALKTLARQEGAELILVEEKRELIFDEAHITLYPPLGRGTSNEEGLFVLASCGEFDALITGDANAFVESLLLKYGANMDEMEKDILRRIIRDNYPPEKYAAWLP